MPLHSLVIPVYDERPNVEPLFERVRAVIDSLGGEFEVILVDDGSRDGSDAALDAIAARDPRFKVVHLSRNFGHQRALSAGIERARGRTVSLMDADLQDPPELIETLLAKWREGYDVVYAVRRSRAGESFWKRATAKLFYRLLHWLARVDIPLDAGDFRLLDRKVVDVLVAMPERNRYLRGLVSWVGFRQIGVPYDRSVRERGTTHYPLRRMIRLAVDGVLSFSTFPLQLATWLGLASALLAFGGIVWSLYLRLLTDRTIHGWTSLIIVVLFLGGAQLLALGVIGEYLARSYDETRGRPLYVVDRIVGFEGESEKPADQRPASAAPTRAGSAPSRG